MPGNAWGPLPRLEVGPALKKSALPSNSESIDQCSIALHVLISDIIQQPAPMSDELHQSVPCMVVSLMNLEMLGKVADPIGK